MPKMELEHWTSLSANEIKIKADELINQALKDFGDQVSEVRQSWEGNNLHFSFKALGFSVSGTAEVRNNLIHVSVSLPLVATMLKGRIREMFSVKAKELFP